MRRRARWWAVIVTVPAIVLCSGVTLGVGQCPEVPPYRLLPPNWPCPAIPTCGTTYGVCRLPYLAVPGQPCACQAADGTWITGVCIRGITR
jgi:hypothetical protein